MLKLLIGIGIGSLATLSAGIFLAVRWLRMVP